jgi:hypothetical protein
MANEKMSMRILEKVELGEMSADEAAKRLVKAKSEMDDSHSTPMEVLGDLEAGIISPEEAAEQLGTSKRIQVATWESNEISKENIDLPARNDRRWETLMWAGVGFVLLSTIWMESRLQIAGTDFWFFAAWLPLAVGVLLIILARTSRNSLWLSIYLNIKNGIGLKRLNLHFPLPSGILSWSITLFESEISSEDLNMLQSILAIDGPLKEPLIIYVNDEDDGAEIKAIIA